MTGTLRCAALHHRLQRREDLLVGQVAGGTEKYQACPNEESFMVMLLSLRFFQVPAKSKAHGRKQFVLVIRLAARGEPFVERGGQHRHRHAFVDGRLDRPAAFAGIGDPAGEFRQLRVRSQRGGRQVQQPRGDHAAAPPDLGHVGQIEVVLVMLRIAQRRRFGVGFALLFADVGGLQNAQALGVGGHDAVLDAVVDHLDEMAGAVRTAMQIALFGGAAQLLASRRARNVADARRQRGEDRDPDAAPRPVRRRSSCSSRAPSPRRRRWCPHPHNEFPLAASSFARRMSST